MTRHLILAAALAILVGGCSSVSEAGGSAGESNGLRPATGSPFDGSIQPELEVGDDDSFSLSFSVGEPRPVVVVAEAVVPSVAAYDRPGGARQPDDREAGRSDGGAAVVAEFDNPTEAGGPLVFQLVTHAIEPQAEWYEVLLPVRPNGTTGWIHRSDVTLSRNPFRIEIDIARYRLSVYKANAPWLTTTVAIGTGDTPTPVGRFYVTELLQPPQEGGPYGPFAFGISGYSETLTNYAGGQGVIGIHGTNDPDSLGTDVSHGCVRMENGTIEELAGVLPLGTPVLIRR